MLDDAMLEQLKEVLGRLEDAVTLRVLNSAHPKQAELLEMLRAVVDTSAQLRLERSSDESPFPRFFVDHAGQPTGIAFSGVPGGHEFTSLILAILNADKKGKLPDAAFLARVARLKGPVRLRTYVSLSCENCPDVVQALNVMAVHHADFEHEMVDGEFVPEEISALKIQGVPSVMAGETLVSSGKASLSDLIERLEEHFDSAGSVEPVDLGSFDIVVVGGGPAGAASAIYTARKGLKTAIVAERLGGQLLDTASIENLISVPYTEGPKLTQNLAEHLAAYDITLLEHHRVANIEATDRDVHLTTVGGAELNAKKLIVATGAKWRQLGVPGEKDYLGKGVAFCAHCDGPLFRGKDVVVVGGGNSGVEAAIDLAGIVKSVTVIEFLETLKADTVLVDKLRALDNATVIVNAKTTEVTGDGDRVTALSYEDRETGTLHRVATDGVFVQIGLSPNSAFLGELVEKNRYGEIVVDDKCKTNVRSIYAAGDVTTVPYKQIVVAMGEGAKAGLSAFEDLAFS